MSITLLLYLNGNAQYYPAPSRIDLSNETFLLQQLRKGKIVSEQIRLQLDLANLYFNKPLKRKADLDHAMQLAINSGDLSTLHHHEKFFIDAQLLIADILAAKKNLAAAEMILDKLKDTAKINLLLNLAFNYQVIDKDDKTEDWKKALDFSDKARTLSIQLKQPVKKLIAERQIATVHSLQGNADAENELLDVLNRARQAGYRFLHYIYHQLTLHHMLRGNPDKAMYYSLAAIKSMNATLDTLAAGDFYIFHALILNNDDDYENGIYYADLAMACYKKSAGKYNICDPFIPHVKAVALNRLKRGPEALGVLNSMLKEYPPESAEGWIAGLSNIGHLYRESKNFKEAEKYFLQAVAISKKNKTQQRSIYYSLGQLYTEMGRFAEAKPYVYKILDFPLTSRTMAERRHFQYMIFLVDSATGDYFSAMNRLSQFRELDNASVRQAKDKISQELNVQFETERKEKELKIKDQDIRLLRQNSRIQDMRLNHNKLIRNITFGATALLFLILLILYRQYRSKQKNNRIITKQNTTITHKNEQLSHLLAEKEILLKEVHHRVKNNLQIMMSLLESQSAYLQNDALHAVEDSQHRLYAMSLIHQKLYQSDDIRTLNMTVYLREFIQYLGDSFDVAGRIAFRFDISPVELSVMQAIPLALIVNEAVTNSIKYAFPEKKAGEILVSLRQTGDDIRMEVADNGVGIPSRILHGERNSLGMDLMEGLSKEINAHIQYDVNNGTKISVRFKQGIFNEIGVFTAKQ